MSPLYVYAIIRGAGGTPPAGVRIVEAGGLVAAVRHVARAPEPDARTLSEHDAVVRALAGSAPAVLPVRFGAALPDEAAVRDWLSSARTALEPALDLVAGREQMMMRLFRHGAAAEGGAADRCDAAAAGRAGPGTRYLAERRREVGWDGLPAECQALRERLRGIAVDERLERHATPPLVATAYHLIARGRGSDYRIAVEAVSAALREVSVAVSGPWPPYAFAPAVLS